ncbi:MAG TPA: sensor histidine kinase, partial [Nitrospiraceae bacterium]|nr:sensor histidine kinase [Nitrospiraceae bacterium]
KNNMQMLQSLLFTSARRSRSEEARLTLEEASSRIAAMAAAQRVLYDTVDATRFDAAQFLEAVCQTAEQAFPSHVRVTSTAEAGQLSNDIAMPLALIVNELLTNAVKHGVSADREAEIRVRLVRTDDRYHLTVEDDGPGYDLEAVRSKSSGLRLVEGLARQIRGTFSVASGPTTRCIVIFP